MATESDGRTGEGSSMTWYGRNCNDVGSTVELEEESEMEQERRTR